MLLLPALVAAQIARNEIVPKTLPERILFFERKMRIEMDAYNRARKLRISALMRYHGHRYVVFRDEVARLRRLQTTYPHPTTVYRFRPAVRRPPPPPRAKPAPLFQPGVYGPAYPEQAPLPQPTSQLPVRSAPDGMDPSTPDEQASATASVNADASASGTGWGTILLIGGGLFLGYKLLKGKKKGHSNHAAAA